MTGATYNLQLDNPLHGLAAAFINDKTDDYNAFDIEALVASGDCFIALASSLDEASELLPKHAIDAQPQLEKVIRSLIYLQQHYKVVSKKPDYKQ